MLPLPGAENCLIIIDPLQDTNNIAHNVCRFDEVQKCFAHVLCSLRSNPEPQLSPLFESKLPPKN